MRGDSVAVALAPWFRVCVCAVVLAANEFVALQWLSVYHCFFIHHFLCITLIIHHETKVAPNIRPVGYWKIFYLWSCNGVTNHLAMS